MLPTKPSKLVQLVRPLDYDDEQLLNSIESLSAEYKSGRKMILRELSPLEWALIVEFDSQMERFNLLLQIHTLGAMKVIGARGI